MAPPRTTTGWRTIVAWGWLWGGLGPARLVERRGRLWRRSGKSRTAGELGCGGFDDVEWVGLIELVAEHKGLGRRACRRQGWWSGRDAEVVQDPGHYGRRRDQGQQNHLSATASTLQASEAEASHQQARPGQPSGSDRGLIRQSVVRGAGLIGRALVCRRADGAGVEQSAGLSHGKDDLLSGLRLDELGVGVAKVLLQ